MANTNSACGDFPTPTFPDLGRCNTYRLKRDCVEVVITVAVITPPPPPDEEDPPQVPPDVCGVDPEHEIESYPGLVPPFRNIWSIYDENCLQILDENDNPITGPTI